MKENVCKGKDEKGTKWRGREPMKPISLKTCRNASFVCEHAREGGRGGERREERKRRRKGKEGVPREEEKGSQL